MKALAYALTGVVALLAACAYLLFGGAIGRLVVPGPSHRLQEAVGIAHLRSDPSKKFPVNIGRLLPYMREADWTSDHWLLWKIPVVVELRNGQRLTIDRLGGQYAIEGVPGVFMNSDMSRAELERYGSELNEALQEKPNQSLEPTPPAGTSAAEQPLVPAAVVAHL